MLLMVEKHIRGGICYAVHRHAKASKNKEDYDPSTESSYLMYWDANNLYWWAMSQKLPVDGFKCKKKKKSRFTEKFIQSYDDDSNKRYIPVVDISYPKHLQKIHSDLSFLPERMKIDKMPETFV